MKRSRFFLGITTTLLAAAGVMATRHYGDSKTRFYITKGQGFCKGVVSVCTAGGTHQCYYTTGIIFIDRFPLFTKGPEGVFPGGSRCTSPLKYNVEF